MARPTASAFPDELPWLELPAGWDSVWPQAAARDAAGTSTVRAQLEEQLLPRYLAAQRWFAHKGHSVLRARCVDHGHCEGAGCSWLLALFDVVIGADATRYFLPLLISSDTAGDAQRVRPQAAALARVRLAAGAGLLVDATADERFGQMIVEAIGASRELPMHAGALAFVPGSAFAGLRGDPTVTLATSTPRAQGSNTALKIGERLFLKLYRRVQHGHSIELEIGRFLTEVACFHNVVPLAGALQYRGADGTSNTLGLLQAFVPNQGDGWDYTVGYLRQYLGGWHSAGAAAEGAHASYLGLVRTLAVRTAELHRAFATPTDDPAFQAEPIGPADLQAWSAQARADLDETLALLAAARELPQALRSARQALLGQRAALAQRLDAARVPADPVAVGSAAFGLKLRHHGDYHLGQVLLNHGDVIIVDFEGEPARPLTERRAKTSPLRDVAGMLRSFSYARQQALKYGHDQPHGGRARIEELLLAWEQQTRSVFLRAYDDVARSAGLYPSEVAMRGLLAVFEIEKALYELRYELRNRPEWVALPLRSLLQWSAA
jgi:maltose alpha-D-glucosyltransferase/alpha-amylase